MLEAYRQTRKDGAVGVDGVRAADYAEHLESNLLGLIDRLKSGRYVAPPVRRHWIPKADGSQRPLGIPTFEDKVAQRAIVMLLEPIFEMTFKDFSYGFRRGRSAHQAVHEVREQIMNRGVCWVLDVDVSKYFDTIHHGHLRKFLDQRVTDGVVRRLLDKWLKAGVLDGHALTRNPLGTPQGGVVSPLLANIYLHYVLDEWFTDVVQPRLAGNSGLVRFCDDFVMVFRNHRDSARVRHALEKRFARFGLVLHPEKTRLVDFRFKRPAVGWHLQLPNSFSFLGFLHVWRKSTRGKWVVGQFTDKSRLARTLRNFSDYCRRSRHRPIADQHKALSRMLSGHFAYFGITGNSRRLRNLLHKVERIWHKWLSRRSRASYITWDWFSRFLKRWPLPQPHIVHRYAIPA